MSYVTTGARKKDAMSLVTGKPVYTGDQVPAGALRLKLLRSPHAHAYIRSIDTSKAKLVPGVVCVLTRGRPIPSPAPMTA